MCPLLFLHASTIYRIDSGSIPCSLKYIKKRLCRSVIVTDETTGLTTDMRLTNMPLLSGNRPAIIRKFEFNCDEKYGVTSTM